MRMTLIALAAVLSAALGISVLVQDDELLPEVLAMVDMAEPPESSQAYIYLLGLHGPAGSNPKDVGQQLLDRIRQHERASSSKPSAIDDSAISISIENPLPLPEGALFCHFREPECLSSLFAKPASLRHTLETHQELLQRWHVFSHLEDFNVLTQPRLSEPFPPYAYLMKASRLSLLNSVQLARTGDTTAAMQQFKRNVSLLRDMLVRNSHLVGKMVTVQLLSDHIDAINALITRYGLPPESLTPLTTAEKSLASAMARELAGIAVLYKQMDGMPDLLGAQSDLPVWSVRFLYKPHITTNALLPVYRDFVQSSEISPAEFARHEEQAPIPTPQPYWMRNPVGTILNNVAMPNMREYAARMHDLDVKIRLFNALHSRNGISLEEAASRFNNPYYPDTLTSEPLIQDGQICLDGPANSNGIRCLSGLLQHLTGSRMR